MQVTPPVPDNSLFIGYEIALGSSFDYETKLALKLNFRSGRDTYSEIFSFAEFNGQDNFYRDHIGQRCTVTVEDFGKRFTFSDGKYFDVFFKR